MAESIDGKEQISIEKDSVGVAKEETLLGSSNSYYKDEVGVALTNAYAIQNFGFTSRSFMLINDDATGYIKWSWDGINDAGKLKIGESISFDNCKHESIYLKGEIGGEQYRLTVI